MLLKSLLLIALCSICQADIYKWVDKDGNVHFGDSTHRGGEKVQLQPLQVYSVPSEQTQTSELEVETATPTLEHSLAIIAPQQQANIWSGERELTVTLQLSPDIQAGQKIALLLDGKVVQEGQAVNMQIQDVNRGTHNLQAQLLDSAGQVLTRSNTVTFHLHQPMVKRKKSK